MGRFCVEDDDEETIKIRTPSGARRLTTTRYGVEDSVDEYCFQHGIPKVQPLPTIPLTSSAMLLPPTKKRPCGQQLVSLNGSKRKPSSQVRDEMDRLSLLLDAALVISTRTTTRPEDTNCRTLQQTDTNQSISPSERSRIQSEMRILRERSEKRNQQNVSKIQVLIDASLQAAEEIRLRHEKEVKEQQDKERAEAEAKAESDAAAAAAATAPSTAAEATTPSVAAATPLASPQRDPEPSESQPPADATRSQSEFVQRAKRLMEKLVGYKESAETFANHPNNKQRRMAMKKLVIRSLNTLTQDDMAKNAHNAEALSQAIGAAKHEDEQLSTGSVPEMARGKRFLVNLMAADVIKRVQAEGFNG